MSLVAAYRKFKEDARGWGVPGFSEFRARLVPLRQQRALDAWSEDDMMYVMGLEEEGAGYALRQFFGSSPAAARVLNEKDPEPISREELDAHLKALVGDCRKAGWAAGDFGALINHLDSGRTPADLEEDKGRDPDEDEPTETWDGFAELYRGAGEGFKRRVRETLASAAGP